MVAQPRSAGSRRRGLSRLAASPTDVVAFLSAFAVLIIGIAFRDSLLRYAVYLAPLILTAYGLAKARTVSLLKQPLLSMSIAAAALLFAALQGGFANLSHVVFILLAFLPLLTPLKAPREWLVVLLALLWGFQGVVIAQEGLSFLTVENNLGASETNTIPGLSGMLLGVFIMLRMWPAATLALLLVLVAGKRSVVVAAVIGIVYAFILYKLMPKLAGNRWQFVIYAFSLVPLFVLALNLPTIYEEIAHRLGVSVNAFTSGRYVGQQLAYEALYGGSWRDMLFGRGLGTADRLAEIAWGGVTNRVHSDYLRMLIDLGVIGTAIFLPAYLKLIGSGRFGPFLIAYAASIWLTGNVIIFAHFGFGLMLMVLVGRDEEVNSQRVNPRTGARQAKLRRVGARASTAV